MLCTLNIEPSSRGYRLTPVVDDEKGEKCLRFERVSDRFLTLLILFSNWFSRKKDSPFRRFSLLIGPDSAVASFNAFSLVEAPSRLGRRDVT